MGGPSSEREISLNSGKAVYLALKESGVDAEPIDIQTDNREENIRLLSSRKLECAFIALHGRFGEDGTVQEILGALKIPYTGSGVSASRLAMDKVASRRIFESSRLHVPRYTTVDKDGVAAVCTLPYRIGKCAPSGAHASGALGLPLVVKPVSQGSSIGLSLVSKEEELNRALDLALQFGREALIEEYIKGRELTLGVLAEKALPIVEILPKKAFFDYEAKYRAGLTDYLVPAQLEEEVTQKVKEAGLSAHRLLGCSGCSRVDIILSDGNNLPFILEVNTIPGFTATSLLPKAARHGGIEFNALCLKLIELAYEKK